MKMTRMALLESKKITYDKEIDRRRGAEDDVGRPDLLIKNGPKAKGTSFKSHQHES